jgi:DNA-binding MarR family transcriptional regulator
MPKLSLADYRCLAAFRFEIRKFLAFSEQAARDAGIEPQQHQLLLAVRGLPEGVRPTIRAVAERLVVQHHTTVALVDKLEARGLIRRERSLRDRREVLLRLTSEGDAMLRKLSALHRRQLQVAGPAMIMALSALAPAFSAEAVEFGEASAPGS